MAFGWRILEGTRAFLAQWHLPPATNAQIASRVMWAYSESSIVAIKAKKQGGSNGESKYISVCYICALAWDHLDGLADDEEGAHAHQDYAQPVLLLLPTAVRAAPAPAAATTAQRRRGEQRGRRSLSAETRRGRDVIAIKLIPVCSCPHLDVYIWT